MTSRFNRYAPLMAALVVIAILYATGLYVPSAPESLGLLAVGAVRPFPVNPKLTASRSPTVTPTSP